MKYWKEAATVIVAASRRLTPSNSKVQDGHRSVMASLQFDYNVLMLKRAPNSSFFASGQVFPGGSIDEADFSPKWLQLFAEAGMKSDEDLGLSISSTVDRPPMIATPGNTAVPNDLAFRICAIRETFEESGILILKRASQCRRAVGHHELFETATSDAIMKEWRKRVYANPADFIEMCRVFDSLPDVWSLVEWSDWLTPASFKKRYDTMFYLCCMDKLPTARQDDKEIVQVQWATPSHLLRQFAEGDYFLPPPQIYEMQRLCQFMSLSELFQFGQKRALLGCQRYMPVRVICTDGLYMTLPGDQHYPDEPILETNDAATVMETSLSENTDENQRIHRNVFSQSKTPTCEVLCNFQLANGHCRPRPMRDCLELDATSKL